MSDKKNYLHPADATQIMVGEYSVKQNGTQVGKLFVEEISGPTHTKEHWLLYSGYRWPSMGNQAESLQFEYKGVPGRLTDFLATPPSGAIYIIADCEQQTL